MPDAFDRYPFFDAQSERHFDLLVEALRNGKVNVVLGAGVSIRAGLPSWPELAEIVAERAGIPANTSDPYSFPALFTRAREALGSAYIPYLREVLGGEAPHIPRALRLLEGLPIECFATTNVDEILALFARRHLGLPESRIYAYPTRRFHLCPILYLHGRLVTAKDPADLVFAASDYDEAYGTDVLQDALKQVLALPTLFIGSSFDDRDLCRVVAELGRADRLRQRVQAPAGRVDATPVWYAIRAADPPPSLYIEGGIRDPSRFVIMENGRNPDVRHIWYPPDTTHTALERILEKLRIMTKPPTAARPDDFLLAARELEELAVADPPSAGEQGRLEALIGDGANQRHFFRTATPSWLPILWGKQLIPYPVEPVIASDGAAQAEPWPCGALLARSAPDQPDTVAEVIRSVKTRNWIAIHHLIEAMKQLPSSVVVSFADVVSGWLDDPLLPSVFLCNDVLGLLSELTQRGDLREGVELLRELIHWHGTESGGLVPRLDRYSLEECLRSSTWAALVASYPQDVADHLLKELSIIAAHPEADFDFYYHPSIEKSDQDHLHRPEDLLVDATRDVLLVLSEVDPDGLSRRVGEMADSPHPIFRRLALHSATECPGLLVIHGDRLLAADTLFDSAVYHEQARLIRLRFALLPPVTRDRVEQQVLVPVDGPALADRTAKEQADLRRAWRILNLIPLESWSPRLARQATELQDRFAFSALPRPDFLAWMGPIVEVTSPITRQQLARIYEQMGIDGLLAALRTPTAEAPIGPSHRAALAWGELRNLIHDKPDDFLPLLERLTPSDFPAAWPLLDEYGELLRAGVRVDIGALLATASRLLDSGETPDLHWSLGHLVRTVALQRVVELSDGDVRQLRTIAGTILEREGTPLDKIAEITRDLINHSLNSPAGTSAEALFGLLARETRTASTPPAARETQRSTVWDQSTIRPVVDRALSDDFGGVELRFCLGLHLFDLLRLDPSWLRTNLAALLPPESELARSRGGRSAFWCGYLRAGVVSREVAESLGADYEKLLRALLFDHDEALAQWIGGNALDVVLSHIAVCWLHGYSGFGLDGLLGLPLQCADVLVRERVARVLGREVQRVEREEYAEVREEARAKLLTYWRERIAAMERETPSLKASCEANGLAWWLEFVEWPLSEIEDALRRLCDHADDPFFLKSLFDYLGRRISAGDDAAAAARVLAATRSVGTKTPHSAWHFGQAGPLVSMIYERLRDDETRELVLGFVNDLLRDRGIDLRRSLA